MSDFKGFLLRGSLIDLAVGFVIGAAFTAVVQALVKGLLTPLIAAVLGKPNFANLFFTVNHSEFTYGELINALISFLLVAAVLYWLVVRPYQALLVRVQRHPLPDPTTKHCPECLSEIPVKASRCAFCTSLQPGAA